MNSTALKRALDDQSRALERFAIAVDPAVVGPCATDDELAAIEAGLELRMPPSFRKALTSLAGSVHWAWKVEDVESAFPEPFDDIYSGELKWSTDTIVSCHRDYQRWVEKVFPNPDDPYDMIWHNKLGIGSVPNGDVLAIDMDAERSGAVIYLSHDDGTGHGTVMAHSLSDLVERWAPIACPGPDDWQWLPFTTSRSGPIDPTCENASYWRQLLKLV